MSGRSSIAVAAAGGAQQDGIASAAIDYSSSTSSSSSSANSSPNVTPNSPTPYQRPSTLHGLKHKLHSATKNLHSPNRRKSVGHIPLSPLARTPSPSPLPQSPTRSPSPLTFSAGHQPGSSNTTQSYSPSSLLSNPNAAGASGAGACSAAGSSGVVAVGTAVPSGCCKKAGGSSFGRPCKTSEPGSPLLRRALSPDRLHPRTAETKANSISPLCDPALKVTMHHVPRVTVTTKSPPMCARSSSAGADSPLIKTVTTLTYVQSTTASHPAEKAPYPPSAAVSTGDEGGQQLHQIVSLPRIAEERDHQHHQQYRGGDDVATSPTDRLKSVKSNAGTRYFFNRKSKYVRAEQVLIKQSGVYEGTGFEGGAAVSAAASSSGDEEAAGTGSVVHDDVPPP